METRMTQDEIIQFVRDMGVEAEPGTRQNQYHQVRFMNTARRMSLNLGFSEKSRSFVADFVFLGADREENERRCSAFILLFGGSRGNRSTEFARLEPGYEQTDWLKR